MFGFLKRNPENTADTKKEKRNNSQNGKLSAIAFVDYEHWYYGYFNFFKIKPNISEWYDEICNEYDVKEVKIFGNFSEHSIKNDYERISQIGAEVIHTASMKDGVDKDFTDVIILDAIYREAAKPESPDVYIIFTGDGHFEIVIKYLKEINKKVYVYGVRHSFSSRLRSVANAYVEMPRNEQELSIYYDMIFTSLKILEKKNKHATYRKTISSVSEYQGIPAERIQSALDFLMKNRYITERQVDYKGKPHKILYVDWAKIKEDKIWKSNYNK